MVRCATADVGQPRALAAAQGDPSRAQQGTKKGKTSAKAQQQQPQAGQGQPQVPPRAVAPAPAQPAAAPARLSGPPKKGVSCHGTQCCFFCLDMPHQPFQKHSLPKGE